MLAADVGERSSEGSMTGDLASKPDAELGWDTRGLPPLCILAIVGLLFLEESSQGEGECGWTPFCICARTSGGGGG